MSAPHPSHTAAMEELGHRMRAEAPDPWVKAEAGASEVGDLVESPGLLRPLRGLAVTGDLEVARLRRRAASQ
jgi:hypothetical protein